MLVRGERWCTAGDDMEGWLRYVDVLLVEVAGLSTISALAKRQRKLNRRANSETNKAYSCLFFFKQKTAYEIGLGIPAEPLFRSNASSRLLLLISKHLILCIYLVFRILA